MTKRFTYTKADGSMSNRNVVPIVTPSDYLFGIDLSEFDADEAAEYAKVLEKFQVDTKNAMTAVVKALGLSSNYRRFKREGISQNE